MDKSEPNKRVLLLNTYQMMHWPMETVTEEWLISMHETVFAPNETAITF